MASTSRNLATLTRAAFVFSAAAFVSACANIEKPTSQPYVSITQPPPKQELRWSNGKMPKSFDPARAAAPPETDVVRALFQGLTEIDVKTMQAVPAAAEKWSSSEDQRTWTFQLRKDAKWSNGKRVIADDFVTAWKRLPPLADKAAHRELFQNIVGFKTSTVPVTPNTAIDQTHTPLPPAVQGEGPVSQQIVAEHQTPSDQKHENQKGEKPDEKKVGVEAVDDLTLKVTLDLPDEDLPKLVADPVFRPVYGDGTEFDDDPLDDGVVTNGAFTVEDAAKDGVVLKRSDTYWNKAQVDLDRIRFVPKDSAEAALESYKKGEIDAVTNADFEPLALKLLTPYEDFRQTTHSALNLYEFNTKNAPFSDRRVREALAISIDRDKLTDGELEGSTQPATTFLPVGDEQRTRIALDVAKAKDLLEKAGFPNGDGFPAIRLVINRNDTQQRVARAVTKMWKQNLNLNAQITVKEPGEMDAARTSGEYDLIRRGVVLPSVDELAGLGAIFGNVVKETKAAVETKPLNAETTLQERNEKHGGPSANETGEARSEPLPPQVITEEDALYEFNAIPLYFPTSYSLVKPYVRGFDSNSIDMVNVEQIEIDNNWQPDKVKPES